MKKKILGTLLLLSLLPIFFGVATSRKSLAEETEGKTYFKVTKGATIGLYDKSHGRHFKEFNETPLTKSQELSDASYDVYTATPALSKEYHLEASIPGERVKKATRFKLKEQETTITMDLTALSDWVPVDNGYYTANMLTNLNDSGTLNLQKGEEFKLDTFRTWQATSGVTENYFIEPDYQFELLGESASIERIGKPGREQLRIKAEKPGVSVIKITYQPVEYTTSDNTLLKFNAIDPRNTMSVVVNVEGGKDFSTGITLRNDFDTVYFDKNEQAATFSFTPEKNTSVRVHDPLNLTDWGKGWKDYAAKEDGRFEVLLKDGRNILELKNGLSTRYYLIKARGIEVTVLNQTNPEEKTFQAGDKVRISLKGIESPVEKLAGIYNPGFGSDLKGQARYSNGNETFKSTTGGQYSVLTDTFDIDYTLENTDLNVLEGKFWIGMFGAKAGEHRTISETGVSPSFNASSIKPSGFGILPKIVLPLKKVTTTVDFEGYNLGQGFYIEPTKLSLPAGSTVADATLQLLNQKGYKYTYFGEKASFYLSRVQGFDKGILALPKYITLSLYEGRGDGSLGEMDYAETSGWMVTVNHRAISQSAGAEVLKDNDVVRWQFTVQDTGLDLGLPSFHSEKPLYTHADKTTLVQKMMEKPLSSGLKQLALNTLINPLATVQEVADVLEKVETNAEVTPQPSPQQPSPPKKQPVTKITHQASPKTMKKKAKHSLKATADGEGTKISYKVIAGTTIGSVDAKGNVAAKSKSGKFTVRITATSKESNTSKTKDVNYTVADNVTKISVGISAVKKGQKRSLKVQTDSKNTKYTYKVIKGANLGKVDKKGNVTANKKKLGSFTVRITAKSSDGTTLKKDVKISIIKPVTKITAKNITVKAKKKATVKAKVDGTKTKRSYKVANKKIATVDTKGNVKGLKKGKTTLTITATTADGTKKTKKITIFVK